MSTQSLRQPALVTSLVASLVLLLLVLLPVSPPASAGLGAHPHQRVTISVLPGIRQNGSRPSASAAAHAVVAATVLPGGAGRPAQLQRWHDGDWRNAQRSPTAGRGKVTFWVPSGGRAATYRVVALPWRGLPAVTSRAVHAAWG